METGPAGGGQQRPAAVEGNRGAVRGGPGGARLASPGGGDREREEGEGAGLASPVIDTDVPLLDLVDGREEGGGEEAEGQRRDGAQLGHARSVTAPAPSAAPARRRPDVITARPRLLPRQGAVEERKS